MSGKILMSGLLAFTVLFGAGMYYSLVYGWYQQVDDLPGVTFQGQQIAVEGYRGIDATSSGLKLRGCFTLDAEGMAVLGSAAPIRKAVPLIAPGWFDCFDAKALTLDIEAGRAIAYLAAENEFDGIDRVIALYPDGRAYQWRQLNDKYLD